MSETRSLKFGALEIGRGVAAAVVVLHHAGNIIEQPRFYGGAAFGSHLNNFNVGVDFFFVLSGFIIAWVHWNDIGEPSRLGRYAVKRFLRIYPPYWAVLVPLTVLYVLFPSAGIPSQRDPTNIVMSALLLPYPMPPVLGVAWTLVHEIFFYAVFAVVIACGRRALYVFPVWAVCIVGASLWQSQAFPMSFLLSPFNLEFILGVGAAAYLRHHRVPVPTLVAAAGTIAFLLLMVFATHIQDDPLVGRIAFGVPAAMFVLGCVEMERRRAMVLPKWLAFFGAASYAVYLVHPVALSFGVHVLSRLPTKDWPLEAVVIVLAILGTLAGFVFHAVIERPLGRRLNRFHHAGRPTKTLAQQS